MNYFYSDTWAIQPHPHPNPFPEGEGNRYTPPSSPGPALLIDRGGEGGGQEGGWVSVVPRAGFTLGYLRTRMVKMKRGGS